jgi:hypothetical protein|tara:strand:- start:649 stop:1026 length:378 start_codon:yes stop_codon:yes gene_type:complete
MAHFAELNSANEVLRVTVVENKDTADVNGVEKEHIGQAHLEKVLGGTWKQTSYNANIRGNYAGKGYTYFVDQDLFMPPKPYNSWSMVTANATWQAPSAMPTDGNMYNWDEDNQTWINLSGASAGG